MAGIVTESIIGLPVFTQDNMPISQRPLPGKEVERTVPFIELVSRIPPAELHPEHVAAGLAAAFTTSIDNPFFKLPNRMDERNGALPAAFAMYAPYYIGTGFTAEQIAVDVATQAAGYLKRLEAQHGYDGYVGRMMSVLRRGHVTQHGLQGIEDRNILFDIHDFLAVITNRLHHLVPLVVVGGSMRSPAQAYRDATHEQVDPYMETVEYKASQGNLNEEFRLPEFIRSRPDELVAMGWDFFKSSALRRGAEFAALAGEKVGGTVIREALEQNYVPPDVRRREYMQRAL